MKLFILRWNPNISSYKAEDHLDLITHIKNKEQPANFNWSIREYENLNKDDLFILQQVGTGNDGIAMIGKFRGACYEGDSWRNEGSKLYYADMWIMDAFNCNNENPLPAERYEKLFPEIKWHNGHSGIVVEEDLDDKLINQIEKDLIEAGIWKEGEIDKFVSWNFEAEKDNKLLIMAKENYLKENTEENLIKFIDCLLNFKVLIPMHVEISESEEKKCFPMLITDDENKNIYPVFSNETQIGNNYQEEDCEFYEISIPLCVDIIKEDEDCKGIILDPFTTPFLIDKNFMNLISHLQEMNFEDEEDK